MSRRMFEDLWQRLQQWPRAAQWAVFGAAGLLALYAYSGVVLPAAGSWNARADDIQKALDEAGDTDAVEQHFKEIEPVIAAVGAVQVPQNEARTSEALQDVINDILKKHTVTKDSKTIGNPVKLPQGALTGVVGVGEQAEHMDARLEFEATPEEAAAIIAELEADPAIVKISSLRLVKLGGADRRISVKLTLETWVATRASFSAGGVRR